MERLPSSADITADDRASRYELLVKIASGGMATVYVGQLIGIGRVPPARGHQNAPGERVPPEQVTVTMPVPPCWGSSSSSSARGAITCRGGTR